jgi:hypothetical protein
VTLRCASSVSWRWLASAANRGGDRAGRESPSGRRTGARTSACRRRWHRPLGARARVVGIGLGGDCAASHSDPRAAQDLVRVRHRRDESLDELFVPAPVALFPLVQVAIPASLTCGVAVVVGRVARRRHLRITVMSPCREFIAEDCATCSVLVRDLFARCTQVEGRESRPSARRTASSIAEVDRQPDEREPSAAAAAP